MADLDPPTPEALAVLVASHRAFLAYVERRVGDRALAEEILQDALVHSLDKVDMSTLIAISLMVAG